MLFLGGDLPNGPTKTTELVTINQPTVREGPELPGYFAYSCSVLVEGNVYLIGGIDTENMLILNTLLMIDVRTSEMIYKRELDYYTFGHACAKITGLNGNKIVVSGGDGVYLSTEIYDINNDIWQHGNIVSLFCSFMQP